MVNAMRSFRPSEVRRGRFGAFFTRVTETLTKPEGWTAAPCAGVVSQTIFEVSRRHAKEGAQIMQRTRAEHSAHLRRPTLETATAAAAHDDGDKSGSESDEHGANDASNSTSGPLDKPARPAKRTAEAADEATVQVRSTSSH